MFDAQQATAEKFLKIEVSNGFLDIPSTIDYSGNLNDPHFQKVLRERAWRVFEEICEWISAKEEDQLEELADITHFLIEFTILSGITVEQLWNDVDAIKETIMTYWDPSLPSNFYAMKFITSLGMAINLLKNRPWKQSTKPLDIEKYHGAVTATWVFFIQFCSSLLVNIETLHELYFKKNQKNHTRIADGV